MKQTATFKKVNTPIYAMSEITQVEGFLGETRFITEKPSKFTGELQKLYALDITNAETGEVLSVWLDGGLKGALAMAKVLPGELVRIIHKGTVEVEGLGRVNDYDIYVAREAAQATGLTAGGDVDVARLPAHARRN